MRFLRAPRATPEEPQSANDPASSGLDLVAVLDALPVGVVVSNERNEAVAVNGRARAFTSDYQRSALLQAAVGRASASASRGALYSEALEFPGADGSSFTISASPLSGGASVAVIEDVSERRQIEAIRRDFVTNVGHELRTPVGAIVLLAESLEGESDEARAQEMRQHIASEAGRAATLIDELLDLSKVQAATEVGFEPLQIQAIIDDVLHQVRPSAVGAGVELDVTRPSDDFTVQGIRADLVSAIGNLVLNAIKYSGDSHVVAINIDVTDTGMCLFRVIDHGVGIPAQDQERIFERFYRVDRSRGRTTGGSGIGLAIVRHVAANHGGWVGVESREGEGSTFTFAVPVNLVVH